MASAQQSPAFDWHPQPHAARWLAEALNTTLQRCTRLQQFSARLREQTGTRLVDWVDQLSLPFSTVDRAALVASGFLEVIAANGQPYWQHPGGLFPLIELHSGSETRVVLRIESVTDFSVVHGLEAPITGEPGALIRSLLAWREGEIELWVREKHGSVLEPERTVRAEALLHHSEALWLRPRHLEPELGFERTRELIQAAQTDLGESYTCDLFFAAERRYWQVKNRAGHVQRGRQDTLGLGWGNHDHHTYRSSREHFKDLIATMELLGLHCRERFYAGKQAGWGAQVMEHGPLGIAVFADVDLSPAEVTGDFAHSGLTPQDRLGTIGLWCRLHGEALLAAGMHHLECQFDFDAVTTQLEKLGVQRMAPFTYFPHLRQAFTVGELWPVQPESIAALEKSGNLSAAQAATIRERGALGSHMEILERNDGYKGFNQTGISEIILQTDPRRNAEAAAP